jgi:hypothetical protein
MRTWWGVWMVAALASAGCVDRVGAPIDGDGARDAQFGVASGVVLATSPFTTGSFVLTVTGLDPGENVALYRSGNTGTSCPGPLGGNCLDLANARLITKVVADASGTAVHVLNISSNQLGRTLLLQAAVRRGNGGVDSVTSNVVEGTFSPPSYLTDEDFESGDLATFPYVNADPFPWAIEADPLACHGGAYCMRTNPSHPLDEVSTISIPMSVRHNDRISFWASTATEPGEHFFRFFIDGVLQLELSGETAWQEYSFPVSATGANGADRTFTWEYTRSTYMDQTHVPLNTVWIDDIDFPDWNTQPGVPALSGPGDNSLVDTTPRFTWIAEDPDFDAVTYEYQYDDDPTFPTPVSTGETYDTSAEPVLADGVWYWRVRSKDNSDYRWSAWSDVRSVEIDGAAEYPLVWQQTHGAQFEANTVPGTVSGGSVVFSARTTGPSNSSGTLWSSTAHNLPEPLDGSGTLRICVDGDFDSSTEYVDYVTLDGVTVYFGNWNPYTLNLACYDIAVDFRTYLADGSAAVTIGSSTSVASGWTGEAQFFYTGADGVVSRPIAFTDVDDGEALVWEKVQWSGSDVTVRVLDEDQVLIPESDLPGNAAGFTGGTVHLFDVDPADYPVLRLEGNIGPAGSLDDWRVVANDRFEWTFAYDSDDEGWVGVDVGATPTLSVSGHLLRYDGGLGGTDPRIEYWFPQPIAANRFTTVEMRLRTSNNYINDDPTLYWASNFGQFDARRSIVEPDVFLYTFTDVTYDLTVVPTLPDEPWQGWVEAIRIDPVIDFVDELGDPDAGWVEIESISIR